jgi:5'-nucleotidase
VFQGGNWKYLLEMLELTSGDNVMYVGDHMYSDILRSKRSLGWRTCLVIPELKEEVDNLQRHKELDIG